VPTRRPIRWRLLRDLASWNTREGRLVAFVAALGLAAAVAMRLLPEYLQMLRPVALACAILVFAIPIGFLLLRDPEDGR
jgi:hypothetical protein